MPGPKKLSFGGFVADSISDTVFNDTEKKIAMELADKVAKEIITSRSVPDEFGPSVLYALVEKVARDIDMGESKGQVTDWLRRQLEEYDEMAPKIKGERVWL